MKIFAFPLFVLTAIASLVAMLLSIYPGVLNDWIIFGVIFGLSAAPFLAVILLVALVKTFWDGKLRGMRIAWKRLAILLAMVLGTYILLKFYIPRRIAFELSRSAFEQLVPEAKPSKYQGTPLNRRLGIYYVDEFAADPRGGIYFRVHTGGAGIGPDRMSYGFVYQPNKKGTPFGAAYYGFYKLSHDWYWFHASDDWY